MKIIGTGSAVPNMVVSNEMLASFLDTNNQWIASRTGIQQRRIISDESLDTLAIRAAKTALASANIESKALDFIICSNVANNYVTPALSCIIQGEIGASCPCIDLNGACAGFIYALDIADAFINTHKASNVLIVCAEEPTKFCNWSQRDTSILFGDGAGAVVVTEGEGLRSISLSTVSKRDSLFYRRKLEQTPFDVGTEQHSPLVMDGKDVFKMAVKSSVRDIRKVLAQAATDISKVKYFLLHQANIRIIDTISEHLGAAIEKFPSNIERYGNTSSASIPILYDEMSRSGKLTAGDVLVFSAFGAGFVSGACVLTV